MREDVSAPNIYDRIAKLLDARVFLLSVVGAFAVLSYRGRQAETQELYPKDLKRLHAFLGPETLYYPNPYELITHVERNIAKDEVAVIVGGSSVMYGSGQGPEGVWTSELAQRLGPGFKVFNFALRAGAIQDVASHVAEALLRRGHRVLFVSDNGPIFTSSHLGMHSHYSFWLLHFRGALEPRKERLALIEETYEGTSLDLTESKLRGALNAVTSSDSFWNRITYHSFSSVWTPLLAEQAAFWKPRKDFEDDERTLKIFPVPERFERFGTDYEVKKIGLFTQGVCPDLRNFSETAAAAQLQENYRPIEAWFPKSLRAKSLVVLSYEARYYLNRLPAETRRCYALLYKNTSEAFQKAGVRTFTFDSALSLEDHIDRAHLSASGGAKLARKVATELKAIAAQEWPELP
jgi:hypothetical protein